MNTDFRLSIGFFEHPKIQKLERKLSDHGLVCFVRLLRFVAQNKPNGVLSGMDRDDIEIAAGFKGDAGLFVVTLLTMRLLDDVDGVICVHDWADHNPYAAGASKRSEIARLGGLTTQENARSRNKQAGSSTKNNSQLKTVQHNSTTSQLPVENSSTPSPYPTPSPSDSDSLPSNPTDSEDTRAIAPPPVYDTVIREPTDSEVVQAFTMAMCDPRHAPSFTTKFGAAGWLMPNGSPIRDYRKLIRAHCNMQEQYEAERKQREHGNNGYAPDAPPVVHTVKVPPGSQNDLARMRREFEEAVARGDD